nr:ribonuclease H-like domain-containing protein [Tanacetum cinerariifolium]
MPLMLKFRKFENSSQSLDKLIGSQITDNSKSGLGYVSYNVVLLPHTERFTPRRIDLSHTGLPEFVEPSVKSYGVTPIEMVTQTSRVKISAPVKENFGAPLIEDWELDEANEVESPLEKERKNVEPSVNKVEVEIPKQNDKPARRPVKYAEMYRTQRPRGLQTQHAEAFTALPLFALTAFSTAEFGLAGHSHKQIEDQGYFDSGCSRHMTRNISYLTDFKEFNGGYVTFRGGAKGGKIISKGTIRIGKLDYKDVYFVKELQFKLFSVLQMCDKKNSVLFTDTECFVLSHDFKLADESHVLLKVSRKNNMYIVDMKNIVSKKDLTYLVVKATNDDSILWYRKLGHINFKNINKLVKDHLVKGLPLKHFENDQTCVACLKRK